MNHLKNFYSEISDSVALRFYGALLSLVHPLTAFFWKDSYFLRFSGHLGADCHAFWPGCAPGFLPTGSSAGFVFWLLVALGIGSAVLFVFAPNREGSDFPKALGFALSGLFLASLLKAVIYAHDYGFMGNYHYMPFFVTAAFLFWTNRRLSIPLLLVGFYVAAGFLKLNPQWILGQTLPKPEWLSPATFSFLCIAVVVLETLLVFFLLSQRAWKRWLVFSALVVFHGVSYYWVGYFYPSVMALLLAIFPLLWTLEKQNAVDWSHLKTGSRLALVPLAIFILMQIPPHLYEGDSAVTTRGRVFALNMFDGLTTCFDFAMLRFENSIVEVSSAEQRSLGPRIKCDPLVFESELRRHCQTLKDWPGFRGASLRLISKRTTDAAYVHLLDEVNYCGSLGFEQVSEMGQSLRGVEMSQSTQRSQISPRSQIRPEGDL
jgi:hypothetical protein